MPLTLSWSRSDRRSSSSKLSALIEIVIYLGTVSFLALFYVLHELDLQVAGILTLALLLGLVWLSWVRLGSGRHPCFLFLGLLVLFQGGRLLAFGLGDPIDPYRIVDLAPRPFGVSPDAEATFLLAALLSAICIYLPCRWNYRFIVADHRLPDRQLLRYLRIAFWLTIPFAILKNIIYFRYASAHGGYLTLFTNRNELIQSVPALVRALSVFLTPIFLAIFVLEKRKLQLYLITGLYFASSMFFLLIGSRSGTLTMILALWCVSRLKSARRSPLSSIGILAGVLLVVAVVVGKSRDSSGTSNNHFTITSFFEAQGTTAGVTEMAIQFRDHFSPYTLQYFLSEIGGGFVPQDQSRYTRGQSLADDITVFVNPEAYNVGGGLGSSYLAEAYIAGAIPGVLIFSLLIGFGLHILYASCASRAGLFAGAVLLPTILWTARAGLFDWLAVIVRSSFLVLVLYLGWRLYSWLVRVIVASAKAAPGRAVLASSSSREGWTNRS